MTDRPPEVAQLADEIAALPGATAVVLGGSRSRGSVEPGRDWDLGLYYRGTIDLSPLAARGTVHPPGSWGRLMNGGAWLRCGEHKVDVLLRDVDVVTHWTQRAIDGEFEVDSLLGYLAGIPTYTLTAELASSRPLRGHPPAAIPYPDKLAAAAPQRWRFCRSFSLDCARVLASRGNFVGAIGHAARAVIEEGHARLCERREWMCNEKLLIDAAGLAEVQSMFTRTPDASDFVEWVDLIAHQLGMTASEVSPWTDAGRRA